MIPTPAKLIITMASKTIDINPLKYIEKLQPYDGRPEDLNRFIQYIDNINPLMIQYDTQSQQIMMNMIKSKFTGAAQRILEIHPDVNAWNDLKNLLMTNFANRKNISQLYEQLRNTIFKGNIINFYNDIQSNLSALNQKCKLEKDTRNISENINEALRIFQVNICEPYKCILAAQKPSTLEGALQILSNSGYLNENTNTQFFYKKSNEKYNNHHQNIRPNRNFNQPHFQQSKPHYNNAFPHRSNNHFPQNNNHNNAFPPRFNNNFSQNNNYRPNFNRTPQFNNQQSRPEPMDIDPSSSQIRRAVHYTQEKTENENFPLTASEINAHYHM